VVAGMQRGGAHDARVVGNTSATVRDGSHAGAVRLPQTPERGAFGRRAAAPTHPPTPPADSRSTPPPAGAAVAVGSAPSTAGLLQGGNVGTAGSRAAPPPRDGSAPRWPGANGPSPSSVSGQGRLVSDHVLLGNLNALSKVASLFNVLWRDAACSCCGHWATEEYLSAGCFHPAVAALGRCKRDRNLQENAAGVAKAKGKRDPSVTDEQRRAVFISLLMQEKTALEYHKDARLNALWLLQYALRSRGATASELTWSDVRVRAFSGMFAGAQREVPLL